MLKHLFKNKNKKSETVENKTTVSDGAFNKEIDIEKNKIYSTFSVADSYVSNSNDFKANQRQKVLIKLPESIPFITSIDQSTTVDLQNPTQDKEDSNNTPKDLLTGNNEKLTKQIVEDMSPAISKILDDSDIPLSFFGVTLDNTLTPKNIAIVMKYMIKQEFYPIMIKDGIIKVFKDNNNDLNLNLNVTLNNGNKTVYFKKIQSRDIRESIIYAIIDSIKQELKKFIKENTKRVQLKDMMNDFVKVTNIKEKVQEVIENKQNNTIIGDGIWGQNNWTTMQTASASGAIRVQSDADRQFELDQLFRARQNAQFVAQQPMFFEPIRQIGAI